jgi:hypothetical protein
MRLVCAMLVSEWCFVLANLFALFRERSFHKDTIPKPGGLGFAQAFRAMAVKLLSSHRPAPVPVLSSFCPARIWALEQ